jgi:transcription elongation factor Elf1
MLVTKTKEDNIAVACADCPRCGKENVVGRCSAARSGYNETAELTITCKGCGELFTVPKSRLEIRRKPREIVDAEYTVSTLPWIE